MTTTDALIARLADGPPPPPFRPGRIAAIMILSILLPVAAFLIVIGPRPELALAWRNPAVPFKTVLPLVLCVLSFVLALRLARPAAQAPVGGWLLMPLACSAALWGGAYALRSASERFAEVSPASVGECLGAIVLLSIIPAIAIMRVLRQGASTEPSLSGGLVGLTAATGATTGYSLFCTQDNPLFFVTWYGLAIAIVTIFGAVMGARSFRW